MAATARPTEPDAVGLTSPPPEPGRIRADDPRLDPWRAALPPEEFAGFHAWLMTFYAFQIEWLFDDSRYAVANKARQIGWSHTTAALLLLWAAFRGQPCMILSKGEREAMQVLAYVGWHIRTLRSMGCGRMVQTVAWSSDTIEFENGGKIVALPATAGRAFSGNLFLDEYAYHMHPDKVWEAAAVATMVGGFRLRVVSTPNGFGNEFHSLWELATGTRELALDDPRVPPNARDVKWSHHEVPLQRAIEQGYPADLNACWMVYAKGDPRLFDQMFNCSFLDSILQYFTSDKIRACLTRDVLRPDDRGICYAGLDIGREADLSCLIVVRSLNGQVDPIHVETIKRTDADGLRAMVAWAFQRYNLGRLCLDATGMGTFPADDIKKAHGDKFDVPHRRNKVEPIDFTLNSKEALATCGYAMMTEGKLRLPEEDAHLPPFERTGGFVINPPGTAAQLRKELGAIRRVVTPSGNVTYDAPRTRDGHADRAWALLLAMYAVDAIHPMVEALQARMGQTASGR